MHEVADRRNAAKVAANRRRTQLLCVLFALLPAVLFGVIFGATAGVVVGTIVGAAVLVAVWVVALRTSWVLALRLIGGRHLGGDELPGVANQVDGLCATIGVTRPKLWLVDDAVANACAVDGIGSGGILVVTSGLVDRMGLIEMEGVLAHELVHLKRRDAVVSAVAVATVGLIAYLTGRDGLVHAAVGRGREYEVDQAAALAVRYPPGLRDALGAMGGRPHAPGVFEGGRWSATRWIWIDPMVGAEPHAVVGELDATVVRRDALAEW